MSALQFLLLEANLADAQVVQATLREGGIDCELLRVETRTDFIRTLETDEIDLILADYALCNFDEIAALTIARRLRPDTPFIFISGSLGEELAIEAIKQGATDYVLKQRLGRLVPSVQLALQEAQQLDKDTIECKQAEPTVDSDLKDTLLLHELSARLVTEGDIQTLYQEIIAAAIALMRADGGTVQILDEATQDLLLLATQGFERNMTEHFYRVNASLNTPCGIALATGKRSFINYDVPESEDPDGSCRMHLEAGYLCAQSTLLITRSGKRIGMFSTHWRKHHRPSDRELRFLDLLARQAADLIEQRQAQVALRASEAKLAIELADAQELQRISSSLLEENNTDAFHKQILDAARSVMRSDMASIQMLSSERNELFLLAQKGFAPESAKFWEWVQLEDTTSCALALTRGEAVIVPDVELWDFVAQTENLWHYRLSGIRAMQSTPLISRDGHFVGMISTHWRDVHQPSERELRLLAVLARQAADLIERRTAEVALRESEAKYRSLFENVNDGFCIIEMLYEDGQPFDYRFLEVNPAFETQSGFKQAIGKTARELAPNLEAVIFTNYETVLTTGEPIEFEILPVDIGRYLRVAAYRHGDPQNKQVAIVFSDITERKQAEEQLRRTAQIDAFRVKLSDALRSLTDPADIQGAATRLLGEHFDVGWCYYNEFDQTGTVATILRDAVKEGLPSMVGVHDLSDVPEFTDYLHAGSVFNVPDFSAYPLFNQRVVERYTSIGMQSVLGVPLVKNRRLIAVLLVADTSLREWSESEITLLQDVAERTWATIERARTEVELRESELQRIREQSAHEEERQRAEALAELDRAKTLFFNNVSHEFRTPLTLILAPVQDALSDSVNPLTSSQRKQLELIHCNSLRLLKLVNTLLDFSRIETDRLKANYEPTDLSTYTGELASVFRSAIENANLQLVVDCPPLADPIYVDREMWEKIVLNLLSNALKFTFEGMICVSLKFKVNTVELMVSDTGVGISASELPHLFKRFYQVKGAKGRSYEGSGIGLSLVQELVKRHGGAIAVTSAVDQGTTFTVTIPTGIAHLPADQIWVASTLPSTAVTANAFVEEALRWLPEEAGEQRSRGQGAGGTALEESTEFQVQSSEVQAQSSEVQAQSSEVQAQSSKVQAQSSEVQAQSSEVYAQSSEVQAQSSKRARILLVDDNADMRGYLRRLLNQYYEVETANDGLAALTAIRRGGSAIYDLVLADVMMPRMDGFELLRSLRASANTQTIPIILLSARAGEESRVEGLETGADDYLIKPFSTRELLARIDANLKLAQLRREAVYREQVMQAVQTLNVRLEQQVKARTAQLEAINQELEAFSSLISHDLRTPLRYISSFAELLQGKLDATLVDTSSLQSLNIIRQSALEAEKMVDDLLEFSRLGKTEMHLTTVNISQLVQQVQAQLQPELIGRSLDWQIEPLPTVEGDPTLLRLVIQNLLSNAIKYSCNNTEAAITIGSIEQEQSVIFFVKDNGAGFDMKYYDQLFSIFQRLHPQEQFPGTGVGLATVRRIIHRHGGRIWAEGAIDQGATFYFSLPKHEA
ncbi:MAG: ATP-binding protein [Nostoc sp.]|uniref:ATP-binding protein n=1 Tax=Nostoc sp. TaxID=1180 RepID=UPI002FF4E520